MKKLILTALLALMAIAAQALTYDVTNRTSYDGLSDYANSAGNSNLILTRLDKSTASQMILTADELIGIRPKTTDSGITRARIKTMSFKLYDAYGYGYGTSTLNMTCYVQNSTETTFPKINDEEQYLPYETNFTAKLNYTFAETYCPGVIELTLTFDGDGFLYTGESILLTTFSEFENLGTDDTWWDGIYCFNPGHGSVCIGELTCPSILQGKASKQINQIPYMRFTYEEEVEKLGPTVTEGPADVYTTVNYDSPNTGNEGAGQILPHDAANYQYSFCQTLYTSEDLKGLNGLTLSGEDIKAKITALTFKISGGDNAEGYYNGQFNSTVYIQNIDKDVTDFPEKDGTQYWFDNYTEGAVGHMTNKYDETNAYVSLPLELTVTFDENNPFIYEGGSVLITWISNGSIEDMYAADFLSQVFQSSGHSAVISSNNDISATTGAFTKYKTHHSSYLPVLKIDYVPLTYSGGEAKTVVSFANVKYGVTKAADSKGVDANNVYVEFDLEDASDCGSYDIYLGTKQIGHMTGKHGFVNFLTVSDKDQTISVTPNGGANVIAGTPLTITASDLNALFAAPEVTETVETMMYGKFDHNDKRVGLQGAAKVKVSAPAPVTAIKLGDNLPIMYQGTSSNGYNDAFEGLIPETATSWEVARDPALNNGEVSFYHNGTTATVDVVRHEPQITDLSGRITLKPTADYVCLTGATVTEAAPAAASASTAKATVSRTAADNYYVRFNAETPVEFDVTMPTGEEKIVMEEDGEYLMFYTTQSATMQYRLEPTAQPEPGINALAEDAADSSYDNSHEWTTAEKGYINLNLQENKGNKVFVRTVDAKGNARLTAYREIKADGTTSGVAEIEADAAAGAEYFNLQGIRVSGELTPGIYIRRQGTTATKVTVK